MNKIEADAVLKDFNFSLKTKAFNSILFNTKKSMYNSYVEKLKILLPEAQAEVYGIILLNSHLNGSPVNWGPGSEVIGWFPKNRAKRILINKLTESDIIALINGLIYIIQPKTYDRWASALKAVKARKNNESQAVSTEIKDLTLAEIENILGYKVKIIS